MVSGGEAWIGQRLAVSMPGQAIPVDVVRPVFYDPEGTRVNG
jgi:sarcosine oxidase subunit alpha